MDYKHGIERLKGDLSELERDGWWTEIDDGNVHQFKHKQGGILCFVSKTRKIHFQGTAIGARRLCDGVQRILALKEIQHHSSPQNEPSLELEHVSEDSPHTASTRDERTLSRFKDSEIVIGLVAPVGADLAQVSQMLQDFLKTAGYFPTEIKVSKDVIPELAVVPSNFSDEAARISGLMAAGNEARRNHKNGGVLAIGAASKISEKRDRPLKPQPRRAFIVNSLKHPDEVVQLRRIYQDGFYLIGVFVDDNVRAHNLKAKGVSEAQIPKLVDRDQDDQEDFGQRVNHAFHLADFFVRLENNEIKLRNSISRIVDILFGNPFRTPTFDEFAMFLAFSAALRSADLSRQVGAIIARESEVLATGANDCPKAGGGLYWPSHQEASHEIEDYPRGRDYTRGIDSNRDEQNKIINEIATEFVAHGFELDVVSDILKKSRINDLTEYGRVVHAEMEAILSCARNNISTKGAHLFCTTFPCHNCAKHIVAAGINRVVFIEPYPKSKAMDFHDDSIGVGFDKGSNLVKFEPFVGVGPRRFFDLFSMRLGAGYQVKRKNEEGESTPWSLAKTSTLRVQMSPVSYLDHEKEAAELYHLYKRGKTVD